MAQVIFDKDSGNTALVLTEAEAATLHTLLWCHIAGDDDGPRGQLSNIAEALNDAGAPQMPRFLNMHYHEGYQTVCIDPRNH